MSSNKKVKVSTTKFEVIDEAKFNLIKKRKLNDEIPIKELLKNKKENENFLPSNGYYVGLFKLWESFEFDDFKLAQFVFNKRLSKS